MARAGQPQPQQITADQGPTSEVKFAAQMDRARITQAVAEPGSSGGGGAAIAVLAAGALAVLFLRRK